MSRESNVAALSGGTGSSKLLRGLQGLTRFTVVTNVGDNHWFHGLYVCPDIDTVCYTLAGIVDARRGWGIDGDRFDALDMLTTLGSKDTWFKIGDRDMATHVYRTAMLKEGKTLTEVTSAVARCLGLKRWVVLPATDEPVETRIVTAERGEMHLQEFWVRERGRLTPTAVRHSGARRAHPTPEVAATLAAADRIILCPANPITSISPILSLLGFRALLRKSKARKVVVSPMVGDAAFSGPAAKLLVAEGLRPTSEGVANLYRGIADVIIVDEADRDQEEAIAETGASCAFTSTLMRTREDEVRMARFAMEA